MQSSLLSEADVHRTALYRAKAVSKAGPSSVSSTALAQLIQAAGDAGWWVGLQLYHGSISLRENNELSNLHARHECITEVLAGCHAREHELNHNVRAAVAEALARDVCVAAALTSESMDLHDTVRATCHAIIDALLRSGAVSCAVRLAHRWCTQAVALPKANKENVECFLCATLQPILLHLPTEEAVQGEWIAELQTIMQNAAERGFLNSADPLHVLLSWPTAPTEVELRHCGHAMAVWLVLGYEPSAALTDSSEPGTSQRRVAVSWRSFVRAMTAKAWPAPHCRALVLQGVVEYGVKRWAWVTLNAGLRINALSAEEIVAVVDPLHIAPQLRRMPCELLRALCVPLRAKVWDCATANALLREAYLRVLVQMRSALRTSTPWPPPPQALSWATAEVGARSVPGDGATAHSTASKASAATQCLLASLDPSLTPSLPPYTSEKGSRQALILAASVDPAAADCLWRALQHTAVEAWPSSSSVSSSVAVVVPPLPAMTVIHLVQSAMKQRATTDSEVRASTLAADAAQWMLQHSVDAFTLTTELIKLLRTAPSMPALLRQILLRAEGEVFELLAEGFANDASLYHHVISLCPVRESGAVALRYIEAFPRPALQHVNTAFAALVHRQATPTPVHVRFVWSDDSLSTLDADVLPLPVEGTATDVSLPDQWEGALRLWRVAAAAHRSDHTQLRRLHAYVQQLSQSSSHLPPAVREELQRSGVTSVQPSAPPLDRATVSELLRKKGGWAAVCAVYAARPSALPPRTLFSLMKHLADGGYVDTAVAVLHHAEHSSAVSYPPYVMRQLRYWALRAARVVGRWRVAFELFSTSISRTGPSAQTSPLSSTPRASRVGYREVAEVLAACAAEPAPLRALHMWMRQNTSGPPPQSLAATMTEVQLEVCAGEGGTRRLTGWSQSPAEHDAAFSTDTAADSATGVTAVRQTEMELQLTVWDSQAARALSDQWVSALDLVMRHLLSSAAVPDTPASAHPMAPSRTSPRALRSVYSILSSCGRWQEVIQLQRVQHALGVPFDTQQLRYALRGVPSNEWWAAWSLYQRATPPAQSDVSVLHDVVRRGLLHADSWRLALETAQSKRLSTVAFLEMVMAARATLPLAVRLSAWKANAERLPISFLHQSTPVYLQLVMDVADDVGREEGEKKRDVSVSPLTVLTRSIRGLQHEREDTGAFVYYRAVLAECWLHVKGPRDDAVSEDVQRGIAAFHRLMRIRACCIRTVSAVNEREGDPIATSPTTTATTTVMDVLRGRVCEESVPLLAQACDLFTAAGDLRNASALRCLLEALRPPPSSSSS